MKFNMPMVWRQPFSHASDCYFCLSEKKGVGKNLTWNYANVDSVIPPVPHSTDTSYPISAMQKSEESSEEAPESSGSEFQPHIEQQLLSQAELNNWVRNFGLSKDKSEIFASRMKERGFVFPDVKTSVYRNRHKQFAKYYTKQDDICFCSDIAGLFEELNEVHSPTEWRLFIDATKRA